MKKVVDVNKIEQFLKMFSDYFSAIPNMRRLAPIMTEPIKK